MGNVKLSSPWMNFYHELAALFKKDPEVKVVYDQEENTIKLYVDNADKADALDHLLPASRTFGNVTVTVQVIPANNGEADAATLFKRAFRDNPAMVGIDHNDNLFDNPFSYVVFRNEVVQYFNDDLSDIHGNCSTLYQEIAKDVFEQHEGVFFCTDSKCSPWQEF